MAGDIFLTNIGLAVVVACQVYILTNDYTIASAVLSSFGIFILTIYDEK